MLAKVAEKYLDTDITAHRDMLSGLVASNRLDQILDACRGEVVLPPHLQTEYQAKSHTYCQVITALIWKYHPHVVVFHYTEKAHVLLHMALISQYINPDLGSCYAGEELMAVVRRIVASSSRASKPITACNTSLKKYARGIAMDLELPYGVWRK